MMYESVNNTIKLSVKTSWLPVGGELPKAEGQHCGGKEMSESDFPYHPNP